MPAKWTDYSIQKLGNTSIGHLLHVATGVQLSTHLGSRVDISSVILMEVAHSVFGFLRSQVLQEGERTNEFLGLFITLLRPHAQTGCSNAHAHTKRLFNLYLMHVLFT